MKIRKPLNEVFHIFYSVQFAIFFIIGISNFVVSLAAYYFFQQIFENLIYKSAYAQSIAYIAGSVWSFSWNHFLTFKGRGRWLANAQKFLFLQFVLMLSTAISLSYLVDILGYPPFSTWFLVVFPAAIINFIFCKYWAWR